MVEMAEDERDRDVSLPSSSIPETLFPSANYAGIKATDVLGSSSLFPCIQSTIFGRKPKDSKVEEETSFDWLTNASYSELKFQSLEVHSKFSDSDSTDKNHQKRKCESANSPTDQDEYLHDKQKKRKGFSINDKSSSDESSKRSKHKKEKKLKHKKSKHSHSKREKDVPKKKYVREDQDKPNTIWIEESGLADKEAYRIYRKPDLDNLRYGTLYRLDIALYKLKSRFLCLGLNKNQAIKLVEKSKKGKKKGKEKNERYWSSRMMDVGVPEVVMPSEKRTNFFKGNVSNYSYVPLELPKGREMAEKEAMSCGQEIEDTATSALDLTERIFLQQTAELNKVLRENPHDIPTWIALAKFQEEAVNKGDRTGAGFTESSNERKKKTRKIVIEKQISVLEKALEQNPLSVELITHHLELCAEIWDVEELNQRWKKVVFTHPNKAVLWRQYLSFVQSRFSAFSFRVVQSAYNKCLSTLLAIKEGTFTSHVVEGDVEGDMLDLFVQYCIFMKQSGHTEKAIASFQAMVELNCFCPAEFDDSTPTSGQLAFLETFWDSGQPRFGEPDAKGWRNWMKNPEHDSSAGSSFELEMNKIFKSSDPTRSIETKSAAKEDEKFVQGLARWQAWLNIEIMRDHSQLKPWQPMRAAGETEDDCEDPERLVIFDDISGCLFTLQEPANKLELVLHLLEFLGVPVRPRVSSNSFKSQRYFTLSVEDMKQLIDQPNSSSWQRQHHWYTHSVQTWPSQEALHFVRNVFVQSLPVLGRVAQDQLMVTWLWFEFGLWFNESSEKAKKQRFKEVHKLAKSLLKQPSNRNSLTLWQEYACMVWLMGDITESRRVLDSTLVMACQMSNEMEKKIYLVSLYRAYAELELKMSLPYTSNVPALAGDSNRALHILTQCAEGRPYEPVSENSSSEVSSGRILKAKRTYNQMCDDSINALRHDLPSSMHSSLSTEGVKHDFPSGFMHVNMLVCCALFAYVSQGIEAAAAVYYKVLFSVIGDSQLSDTQSLHRELIWTSFIHLLKSHTQKQTMHLKELRKAIHRALSDFPDNPDFLDFYLHVESKSNLTGEVRRFFDHGVQTATSPVLWIYAIHYEQMRSKALVSAMDCTAFCDPSMDRRTHVAVTSVPLTGITHRQRALLDRASSCSVGRQCVALWRMYIDFEMKHGTRDTAKAVFYQALHHCPWAKCLYLDAVKHFPDDVQGIIDMMDEKELRVRAPLEEIDILMQA